MQNYVKDMDYQNLDKEIKRTMRRSAKDAVMLGYMLRRMMTAKLWKECYDCFEDYLQNELHMDYTMANRFIGINKKYSFGGESMDIDEKWAGYSQAVLIEMLSMPPGLEEKITPDMTVRQVREVKRQARQEKQQEKVEAEAIAKDPVTADIPDSVDDVSQKKNGNQKKKCDAYQGYSCDIERIMEKHFTKGGDIIGCAGCCDRCLDRGKCEYTCEAVMSRKVKRQDDIPDAEYRELEAVEDVATSQPKYSPYGLAKSEYPEGSLIATEGCGNKHYCFSCALNCGIRQKLRYCRTAPLGNPFSCTTMEVLENLKEEVGDRCQFLNNDLAPRAAGNGEVVPCCRDCKELCGYRCRRSSQGEGIPDAEYCELEAVEKVAMSQLENVSGDSEAQEQFYELKEIKHILKKEQDRLDEFLVADCPKKLLVKQNIIVAALEGLVRDLENEQPEAETQEKAVVQPELPKFKNNNQRKDWLNSYKSWGLWYRDDNIGVDYYKYDFDNGARLIAEVYQVEATKYYKAHEACFLHLVGGPKPPKGSYGIDKWVRNEKYSKHPNSETELVEFLKEVQKGSVHG